MTFFSSTREFIQRSGAKHWQFLFLSFIVSFVGGVLWFYATAVTDIQMAPIGILAVIIQSQIAYFYMLKKGEARKVFFSLVFAFFTFFICKYLFFEHYYDFYLEAYIDRSIITFDHIVFYFSAINWESIFLFFDSLPLFITIGDIITLLLMILATQQYIYLPFTKKEHKKDANNRIRFKKRRFD